MIIIIIFCIMKMMYNKNSIYESIPKIKEDDDDDDDDDDDNKNSIYKLKNGIDLYTVKDHIVSSMRIFP